MNQRSEMIAFRLDGVEIHAAPGETILQVAQRYGVDIPCLCYKPGYRPDGNCRACMVEIKGERVLAPSCCRAPKAGMEVESKNARAVAAQKMILELLLSDMPEQKYSRESELDLWARNLKVGKPRFARRHQPKADLSHPGIAANLHACIQCTRCLRPCPEGQATGATGDASRGDEPRIIVVS